MYLLQPHSFNRLINDPGYLKPNTYVIYISRIKIHIYSLLQFLVLEANRMSTGHVILSSSFMTIIIFVLYFYLLIETIEIGKDNISLPMWNTYGHMVVPLRKHSGVSGGRSNGRIVVYEVKFKLVWTIVDLLLTIIIKTGHFLTISISKGHFLTKLY